MSTNYIVYIDESGKPYQLNEGPYVLSAITVRETDVELIEESINRFIEKWNEILRRKYNDPAFTFQELHARQIIQGENPWRIIRPKDRSKLINEFGVMISDEFPIVVNMVIVRKRIGSKIHSYSGVRRKSHEMLIERAILFTLPHHSGHIKIMYDSMGASQDANIKNDLLIVKYNLRANYPPARRVDLSIDFVDSKHHPIIQIADLYAYTFRQASMYRYKIRNIDLEVLLNNLFKKIRKCPDKDSYEGCGLKHWDI